MKCSADRRNGEQPRFIRTLPPLPDSQFNLGTCYDVGWGVEKNEAEALKWYRKASAQGCKLADDMIRELTQKK